MNSKSGHLKSGWRGKKNEKELEDLRDLWDTLRWVNIQIMGVWEGEEREREEQKAYFKK